MATLYRQYRPQNFSSVVNQQHIRLTLEHALEHDRVAHAYLFTGPRGIGKTTMARILARAVNCTNRGKNSEPCGTCTNCKAILNNSSLDIIEIDAASQTGVDNVRENIIQSARSVPSLGKYKVFIIDEVHMLSMAAFNALLKLLEEPPAHAMFILATTEVHRVPETIISRTQRFDFKKLQLADIVERLQFLARQEKRQLEQGVAERIARQAGGSLRDAESMLGQLFSFRETTITQEIADLVLPRSDQLLARKIIVALTKRQAPEALTLFHGFCQEGGDIPSFVADLVHLSRALLLASVDPSLLSQVLVDQDAEALKELNEVVTGSSTIYLTGMVEHLLLAQQNLYRAQLMELPVEVAFISIAGQGPTRTTSQTPVAEKENEVIDEPKKNTTEPIKNKTTNPSAKKSSTIENYASAWQQVQTEFSKKQPSLALSLRQAVVAGGDAKTLHVKVPFKLHADRLSDPKVRGLLEDRLHEITGHKITIEVTQDPSVAQAPPPVASEPLPPTQSSSAPSGDLWDSVVKSF